MAPVKHILLLSFLAFYTLAFSQTCEHVKFTRQGEVDSFPINFPGCQIITGITIEGGDITDLYGLSAIHTIEQGLRIDEAVSLTTLAGLENIRSIGGGLQIFSNTALQNLSGLINLQSV